jgi:phage/conjugal plasmid C-4 type zinc finger TraR family protein
MNLSNAAFDLAAARAEQERDAGVADAGIALAQTGSDICIACGEPISRERRLAAPFARRCIECQTTFEIEKHSR